MNRVYLADMKHPHGVVAHWKGGWDEPGLCRWVEGLRSRLDAPGVTLGLLFTTPQFFDHATELLELVRVYGRVPMLVGCSSHALVADRHEFEPGSDPEPGMALALYHLPGARLKARHLGPGQMDAADGPVSWHRFTDVTPAECHGWLTLANPFGWDGEAWMREWNAAYPGCPCVGGLATGNWQTQEAQVYLNGQVHEDGAVVVNFGGNVVLEPIVSQGCTPIGQPWTITKADRNYILSIANRPAYSVLVDTFNGLTKEEQGRSQGNVFVGFASSEYREDFHRGDFLVRNLIGADPNAGVLAVGAQPRAGQTIQFQRRDAAAATEDLSWQLARTRERLAGRKILGGFLGVCGGRGEKLFNVKNHDAGLVQEQLGPLPLVGCFCAGEIGPVGSVNFLHGYTATLGLFTEV